MNNDKYNLRLEVFKAIYQSSIGNERLKMIELAEDFYNWIVKEDTAKEGSKPFPAPNKAIKSSK